MSKNHMITDDAINSDCVYARQIENKFEIFCECEAIIQIDENPDGKFLVCDNNEKDYYIILDELNFLRKYNNMLLNKIKNLKYTINLYKIIMNSKEEQTQWYKTMNNNR